MPFNYMRKKKEPEPVKEVPKGRQLPPKKKEPEPPRPVRLPEPIPPEPPPTQAKPTPPPKKKKKKYPKMLIQRLPAGSEKYLVWDGKLWKGVLTIPTHPDDEDGVWPEENGKPKVLEFWYEATNEAKVFHGLHAVYEQYLREQQNKPESTIAELPPTV